MYDLKEINKELDKLRIPPKWRKRILNLNEFVNNDLLFQLSIRKDAGKTTGALLLGLVFKKLYGKHTIYMRSDERQITRSNVETLYNVIIDCGYIELLFNGEYNTVLYKPQLHKFYLAFGETDENGNYNYKHVDNDPLCHVICLENHTKYKSNVNDPYADYIVFDEFMDTERSTYNQIIELQNNISTFGRERDDVRVVLLGNNVDQYSFWFEEFCLSDDIPTLDFGGYIKKRSELGTTLYMELLEKSEEKQNDLLNRKIRFSGFNTPKLNAFNGVGAWQGLTHPHLPYTNLINESNLIYDRLFIRHRTRYIQICYYFNKEFGNFCYLHFANEPKLNDNIILCQEPQKINEVYKFGEYVENERLRNLLHNIYNCMWGGRVFFSSNQVGDLFTNYKKDTNTK